MSDQPPMGATVTADGVEFRVWAPPASRVDVVVDGERRPLAREDGGVWWARVAGAAAGTRYGFVVDGRGPFADPYSRSQPEGPHGLSEVVDPARYGWGDDAWPGVGVGGLVLYELHVGTFTRAGTFEAAIGELQRLRELGVGAIELMPVAEFPGARNWGYDGVNLFAPSHVYGGPEGLRRLVDAAHTQGIGVLLDVVYNHLGPDGNYLREFSPAYFTSRYHTPWGEGINYDGPGSAMVRRFVIDNARRWLREYHVDGFRLDATFAIIDDSPRHILAELSAAARAAVDRDIVLVAETHENDARYVRPVRDGGFGFDAAWADDFHHAMHTLLTGERDGYYAAYDGRLSTLAETINGGWLRESADAQRAARMPAAAFVYALQNHDQVGNRARGERLHHLVGHDVYRAAAALLLLLPCTPLIFMGDEFAATTPFLYFTDHHPELGRKVTEGRRREFAQFAAFADPGARASIPDPQDVATFERSRLRAAEHARPPHREIAALYADLLALRRGDAVISQQDRRSMRAVAVTEALLLVHWATDGEQRLLAVNFGEAIDVEASEVDVPAGARGRRWRLMLCTDAAKYGGAGGSGEAGRRVRMPARSAALFGSGA